MSVEFNWFPGHMNKTLKEIEKRIPIVDLVIQIVDARAPYSSQNHTFKKLLATKPMMLVFSKADIADPKITQEWVDYYSKQNVSVLVLNNRTENILKPIIDKINEATAEKQARDKKRGLSNSLINALVIGIPNVGKSTFINRAVKGKKVRVGNLPGLTRGIQNVQLNNFISLLDTPGVLPSKFESEAIASNVCAINSIKREVFPNERIAGRIMRYVFNNYEGVIENHYKISTHLQKPIQINDTYILFEMIAKYKNWNLVDGLPDILRTINLFLNEIADGSIGKISFERPNEIIPEEIEKLAKTRVVKTQGTVIDLW